MIAFPNCKINLGLRIIGKREDGFHNLETVFFPIFMKDVLEILPCNQLGDQPQFNSTGLQIPGIAKDNLCLKAYYLLKKHHPLLPGVRIHLHKNIPIGAGLGGGSSDASSSLLMMNSIFNLGLNDETLEEFALELGSDCPFFLHNEPCYASGRGEILEPIAIDLSLWKIMLVHPGIHINTAWAFSQIKPANSIKNIRKIISQPVTTWKDELLNDFEKIVMQNYPGLHELKNLLYNKGAAYVSMSGSGSSFFAIFPKTMEVETTEISFSFNLLS